MVVIEQIKRLSATADVTSTYTGTGAHGRTQAHTAVDLPEVPDLLLERPLRLGARPRQKHHELTEVELGLVDVEVGFAEGPRDAFFHLVVARPPAHSPHDVRQLTGIQAPATVGVKEPKQSLQLLDLVLQPFHASL